MMDDMSRGAAIRAELVHRPEPVGSDDCWVTPGVR